MPYKFEMVRNTTDKPRSRKNEPEGMSARDVPDKTIDWLNKRADFLELFGIPVDEKTGKVPESDGFPRIFVMGKDKNNHDRPMSLEEAGVELKSREFWYQAQLGNVFVLPAGMRSPLQFQLELTKTGTPSTHWGQVGEEMPDPPPLKRPSLLHRIAHWFNKNAYKDEIEQYDNREQDIKNTRGQLGDLFQKRRVSAKQELDEVREIEEDMAEAIDQQRVDQQLKDAAEDAEIKQMGRDNYTDLIAPKPVFHPELERVDKNGVNVKQGFYSKKNFDTLEKLDHDYSEYQVGGKTVTKDQYAGLVASASTQAKYGEATYKTAPEYDPSLKPSIMNLGHTKEQADEILAEGTMTVVSVDLMRPELRNNQDDPLGTTVNPARKEVMDALESYKNNDKEPLARILANGVNRVGNMDGSLTREISDPNFNLFHFTGAAAEMMDDKHDPELRQIAEQKYGMDPNALKAVQGLHALDKADTAARDAKHKLAIAEKEDVPLHEDTKRAWLKDILKAELMKSMVLQENELRLVDPKTGRSRQTPFRKESDRMVQDAASKGLIRDSQQIKDLKNTDPAKIKLPPAGSLYADQVARYMNGRDPEFNVHPNTLKTMDEKSIEEMADKLIDQEKLTSDPVHEINRKLKTGAITGPNLIDRASDAMKGKADEIDLDAPLNINAEIEKKQNQPVMM